LISATIFLYLKIRSTFPLHSTCYTSANNSRRRSLCYGVVRPAGRCQSVASIARYAISLYVVQAGMVHSVSGLMRGVQVKL